jgi:peptidoglycan/xylan/chitin deacetylase (PgdA/CDA1 family)
MRGVSHSAIVAAGFRIGDHTITHPYLTRLSDADGPPAGALRWSAAPLPGAVNEQHEPLPGLHFRDVWRWR